MRAALGETWQCVLANDIDPMKCRVYRSNWGDVGLVEGDIADLNDQFLRQPIDLYWASSPCQDFSLAGKGKGLVGERSGVFAVWAEKISESVSSGFAPKIIAFENVVGLISRDNGRDFSAVVLRLSELGYSVGALEIDASGFLPQSRPRLFVIAVRNDLDISGFREHGASGPYHSDRLKSYVSSACNEIRERWVWWKHTEGGSSRNSLIDLVDDEPDTHWLTDVEVNYLLSMMSEPNLKRVEDAKERGGRQIGMLYKRGRPDGTGRVRQRAEIRFDGLAGCLRTPTGGSSRQTIVIIEEGTVKARLLSSREVGRLMGLPDTFRMPSRYNQAYQVAGDGVAVPVVRYLDEQFFRPFLLISKQRNAA